jgi:hypothetical protein
MAERRDFWIDRGVGKIGDFIEAAAAVPMGTHVSAMRKWRPDERLTPMTCRPANVMLLMRE